MIVCPLHWYFNVDRLADVKAEMRRRGPPRLRGRFDDESGAFMLREGTHRIRAAHRLGLIPVLVNEPWRRTKQALINARVAASMRGLAFDRVELVAV